MLVGLDIGGTSVRVAVTDGMRLLSLARGAGASIRSSGPRAATRVRQTTCAALEQAGLTSAQVTAIAVGAAGAASGRELALTMVHEAFADLGLPGPLLTDDLTIAFRSASPTPEGVLLLAGTGAGAASFNHWSMTKTCDLMGWLVGDTGSGVWLGRCVLRAAAADLDARGPRTVLTRGVLDLLGIPEGEDPRPALIHETATLPPAEWARFARLAIETDGRDEVSTQLLDEAAAALTRHAECVGATDRVVLAGGLLRTGALVDRLRGRFDGPYADHPVLGALMLAAESVGTGLAPAVHAQIEARCLSRVQS